MATKVKLIADSIVTTDQLDTTSLDAHFTGGTGVTYSGGTISIGQAVHSTDSPTFADLTVTGNLNITGDINSYNVTDLNVADKTITLGAGQIDSNSDGSGIIIDGSGASILWNESGDKFDVNKGITTVGTVHNDSTQVGFRHTAHGIATGNTNKHGFQIGRWIGSYNKWMMLPETEGSPTYNREFGFNFANNGWFVEGPFNFTGTVGIGTTPSFPLHVNSSSTDVAKFQTSGSYTYTRFQNSSRTWALSIGNDFSIYDEGSSQTRLTINTSGNVGIGGTPQSSGRLLVQNAGTNQIVLTNDDSATTNLNMGNFAGGGYISQNYYYSSGHQADDNTKGAFEVFITHDAYGVNYHSAGAMGTRRRDFAITSAGNTGIGINNPSETLELTRLGKIGFGTNGDYGIRLGYFDDTGGVHRSCPHGTCS